jgi:hypothetical protein
MDPNFEAGPRETISFGVSAAVINTRVMRAPLVCLKSLEMLWTPFGWGPALNNPPLGNTQVGHPSSFLTLKKILKKTRTKESKFKSPPLLQKKH